MGRYLLRRLLQLVPVFIGTTFLIYWLVWAVPVTHSPASAVSVVPDQLRAMHDARSTTSTTTSSCSTPTT